MDRALLIVNRHAANGHSEAAAADLDAMLGRALGPRVQLWSKVVASHPEAADSARRFLAASDAPALVVVGGGGGTLRAVIEGVFAAHARDNPPGPQQIRIAALRMGSGNVVARELGVPKDAQAAVQGLAANARAGRLAACCVIRCETGRPNQSSEVAYGVAMAGLGQFGRAPGDLSRWRTRYIRLRRLAASALGIERLNRAEYVVTTGSRCVQAMIRPTRMEEIEIRTASRVERIRLLAGAVLNFHLAEMPFRAGVGIGEPAVDAFFVSFRGRRLPHAIRFPVRQGDRLEVSLLDRDSSEGFLDEDPLAFSSRIVIEVAGTLAFVPGPAYGEAQR